MTKDSVDKKKLLILISRCPWPLNSGGRVATYGTLKVLEKYYELYLVIVEDGPIDDGQRQAMREISKEAHFFSNSKTTHRFRTLQALFNSEPLQVNYFYSRKVQRVVDELLTKVDLTYVFMTRMTKYLRNSKIKGIFNAIDSMYLNYQNSVNETRSWLWKMIYRFEIKRLFDYEKSCVEKFDLSYFVNVKEATFWKEYGKNVTTIPFSGDDSLLEVDGWDDTMSKKVTFMGRLDYPPNVDAVKWFVKEVLPHINSTITFHVIGGFATKELKDLEQKTDRMTLEGFVDDPNFMVRSSLCNVAPMQTGGGLQTKVISAMALEGLVVGTSKSIGAIVGSKDGMNMIVRDDPREFAEAINDICKSPEDYLSMRKEARRLVQNNYSWQAIEQKIISNIESLSS